MNPAVRTAVDDGVLTITLDRPKANAIDVTTSLALHGSAIVASLKPDRSDDGVRPAAGKAVIASLATLPIVPAFLRTAC